MCASSNKLNSSSRKRRAASLTAEALWNIQMEDANSRQCETAENLPIGQFGTETEMDLRKSKNIFPENTLQNAEVRNSSMCVHFAKHRRVESDGSDNKSRPMASVIPVVKPEVKSRNKTAEISSSSSVRNSQILLLPISLNPSVSADVPIFTLHPASLKMDFGNYLTVSNLSPVINIVPMMANSMEKKPLQETGFRTKPGNHTSSSYFHGSCKEKEDQVEPLNLKLGESTIPSKRVIQNEIRSEKRSAKSSFKSLCSSLWIGSNKVPVPHCPRVQHQRSCKEQNTIQNQDCHQKQDKDSSSFVAYSPSSDSSCSVEADAQSSAYKNNDRKHKRQKACINLRCKAAPPSVSKELCTMRRREEKHSDNNHWKWEGEDYHSLVYSVETGKPVMRKCFSSMRRKSEANGLITTDDDVIMVHDCVVMRANANERPYIAKIVALWQHPGTGKMMISLLWFYRPEHTEDIRAISGNVTDAELFASRHLDEISVACVEDKCHVLTFSQYCRYVGECAGEQNHVGANDARNSVPGIRFLLDRNYSVVLPTEEHNSLVYFCRKFYDIKSHRFLKSFPIPTPLFCSNVFGETSSL